MSSQFGQKTKGAIIMTPESSEASSDDKENQNVNQNSKSNSRDSKKSVIKGLKCLGSDSFLQEFASVGHKSNRTLLDTNSRTRENKRIEESKSEDAEEQKLEELLPLNKMLQKIDSKCIKIVSD